MKLANEEGKEYVIQALRAFANLCFDEGKCSALGACMRNAAPYLTFYLQDDNRKQVAESEVIPTVVEGLSSKNPALVRTTCGALMNLCIDSGKAQNLFHESLVKM
jgi:hypothetical protein